MNIEDPLYTSLVERGLINDIRKLVDARHDGSNISIQAHPWWNVAVDIPGHRWVLTRDEGKVYLRGDDAVMEYPCDANAAVEASIDLCKALLRNAPKKAR